MVIKMSDKTKHEIISWLGVFAGCCVMSAGFVLFINPYYIVPGGTYGASIVLHSLFHNIQVGTFAYFFEIPLLVLSVLLLGAKLGMKTCAAALVTPLIMNVMSMLVYPTTEALHALDPAMLLNGRLDLSNHLILAVLIGSGLIGLGCGIVVKCGATTGGSDIVAMILQKYFNIKFSRAILIVDGFVVLFGLIVISVSSEEKSGIMLSLYSLIAIYITAQVIARTINGPKDDKMLFVISGKDLGSLHDFILIDMDRTATLIKSSGLYTKEEKEMLCLVVSYKEVNSVKTAIKKADPDAFVIVTDAYDTYGEGWKRLPNPDEIHPE